MHFMPIDFVKCQLTGTSSEYLKSHSELKFFTKVENGSGELSNWSIAKYHGLIFKIYERFDGVKSSQITIEGSIHKYWNNGLHNSNDFRFVDVIDVLEELSTKFKFSLKDCRIRQIEIGVNINMTGTNYVSSKIINGLVLHGKVPFKSHYTKDEGSYKIAKHQRYLLKVYDKGQQQRNKNEHFEDDVLRIEMSYKKMKDLNDLKIYTLQDVIKSDYKVLLGILLKNWKKSILFDQESMNGDRFEFQYESLRWWNQISEGKYKYHKRRLENTALKLFMEQIVNEKVNELI